MSADVKMTVRGVSFTRWVSVNVSRSIENAAASFSLAASTIELDGAVELYIRPGDACTISIVNPDPNKADTLVITGYIDAVDIQGDANSETISIRGRSKTGQLVDCAAIGTQWKSTKLEEIAGDIAAVYGVSVDVSGSTGDPIARFAIEQGETAWEAIERAARLRGMLVTDTPAGKLLLTRSLTTRCHDALIMGGNILTYSCSFDVSGVYSEYRCKGQVAGSDDTNALDAAQMYGTAADDDVALTRIMLITPEQRADRARCQQRAEWEAATRAGQALTASYTVEYWHQSNEALWLPNQLVSVDDPRSGIDGELLIVDVAYTLDLDGGQQTAMTLHPPAAYELLSPAKRKATPSKKRARGSSKWFRSNEVEDLEQKLRSRVPGASKTLGQGVGQ